MSFTIGPPGLEKPAFQRISNSHFKSRSLNVLLGRMLDLLKTETMVSKNPATSAFGLGSLVFRDHSLGFKKVYPNHYTATTAICSRLPTLATSYLAFVLGQNPLLEPFRNALSKILIKLYYNHWICRIDAFFPIAKLMCLPHGHVTAWPSAYFLNCSMNVF